MTTNQPRVLITGITGLLGNSLAKEISNYGQVYGIARHACSGQLSGQMFAIDHGFMLSQHSDIRQQQRGFVLSIRRQLRHQDHSVVRFAECSTPGSDFPADPVLESGLAHSVALPFSHFLLLTQPRGVLCRFVFVTCGRTRLHLTKKKKQTR